MEVLQGADPRNAAVFLFFFPKDQEDVYFMKGAFEEVINHCTSYNNGGLSLPLTPQQTALCHQEERRMGSLGLRGWYLSSPAPRFKCAALTFRVSGHVKGREAPPLPRPRPTSATT